MTVVRILMFSATRCNMVIMMMEEERNRSRNKYCRCSADNGLRSYQRELLLWRIERSIKHLNGDDFVIKSWH